MDFDTLEKLDADTIRKGVKNYRDTALALFDCGQILADHNKYGPAIAMIVLSIEELIKSYATFMYYIGDRTKNNIDAAFKGTIDAKSVHQTRLKYASGLNHILSKINTDNLAKALESKVDPNLLTPKNEIKTEQDKLQWFQDIAEHVVPLIPSSEIGLFENGLGLNAEIDDILKDSSNWFLHAKTQKENGIYADYINNSWHSPLDMKKEKYDEAKNHAKNLFNVLGDVIERAISMDNNADSFVRIFVEKYLNSQAAER